MFDEYNLSEEKISHLRDVLICYGAAIVCILVAIGLVGYALQSALL
jgi:hypothetical protein